jgi:hypothetical protein
MAAPRIFRYRIPVDDFPVVDMPVGAEVLTVAASADDTTLLDMWAVVDPAAPVERRAFRVVGTGNPMPDDCGRYVGTAVTGAVQVNARPVWHVFEAKA